MTTSRSASDGALGRQDGQLRDEPLPPPTDRERREAVALDALASWFAGRRAAGEPTGDRAVMAWDRDDAAAVLAVLAALPPSAPPQGCSCHPDDEPPEPCPRKHALTDCRAASAPPQQEPDGWLPIVLCPTDGVDRALLLPDGREVVGAHHNPGSWRVCSLIEYEQTVYEEKLRGGVLPMTLKASKPDPERVPVGKRQAFMRFYSDLPEGVYPTHFRPNDTVHGAAVASAPPQQGEGHQARGETHIDRECRLLGHDFADADESGTLFCVHCGADAPSPRSLRGEG